MAELMKGGGGAELSTDIHVITAEINAYQRVAGEAIFEIGRRLKHVKENDLAHGEFGKWTESIGMDARRASEFITVFEKLAGEEFRTYGKMGMNALYLIATMPEEARNQPHALKSGEVKTPDKMTVRELREVKAELKKEKERREQAEARALEAELKPPRTEYIEVPDETAEAELELYKEIYGELDGSDAPKRIDTPTEFSGMALAFSSETREFIRRFSYLREYKQAVSEVEQSALDEYTQALEALKQFTNEVGRAVTRTNYDNIIEMEAM